MCRRDNDVTGCFEIVTGSGGTRLRLARGVDLGNVFSPFVKQSARERSRFFVRDSADEPLWRPALAGDDHVVADVPSITRARVPIHRDVRLN
jgi:hypothetical protein